MARGCALLFATCKGAVRRSVELNSVSYTALVAAATRSDDLARAVTWAKEGLQSGAMPQAVAFNEIVDLATRRGEMDIAPRS
eukprot:298993-Amphidinium_carterae.1